MKGLILCLIVAAIILALGAYLTFSLRDLWRSTKRFGREGARLIQAPSKAAERHPPRSPDAPTPAPFHDYRRRKASEDLRRVRLQREQRRDARLERATKRWHELDESAYARFDREAAREHYRQRKDAQ